MARKVVTLDLYDRIPRDQHILSLALQRFICDDSRHKRQRSQTTLKHKHSHVLSSPTLDRCALPGWGAVFLEDVRRDLHLLAILQENRRDLKASRCGPIAVVDVGIFGVSRCNPYALGLFYRSPPAVCREHP